MSEKTVAVLGATGVVGRQMLALLEERDFPVRELVCLASARSAGKTLNFRGEDITIQEAGPNSFDGIDIVLSAVEDDMAKELLPHAVAAGATCIDNSHAFRLDEDVPLVIPEINPEDVRAHKGIIANPNCATIIGLVALWPLHQLGSMERVIVSTYQAASGAGAAGLSELERELACVVAGEPVGYTAPFAHQLANNLIPQIGSPAFEGYTSEEMKFQNEGRKICHLPELKVNCTCVRVPVMRSHSESITVEFEREVTLEDARVAFAEAPGVKLLDDTAAGIYPMPLDASDQDFVYVGRLRKDLSAAGDNSLSFWCSGDQIRKGAATNAVQIAELVLAS